MSDETFKKWTRLKVPFMQEEDENWRGSENIFNLACLRFITIIHDFSFPIFVNIVNIFFLKFRKPKEIKHTLIEPSENFYSIAIFINFTAFLDKLKKVKVFWVINFNKDVSMFFKNIVMIFLKIYLYNGHASKRVGINIMFLVFVA